uniref:Coiled-coil domain-containing protein 86 n=1 Tax=Periophthalmus magnuspinnatus TaxID=409849 RepID=A0A3B4BKY9_9GOBI
MSQEEAPEGDTRRTRSGRRVRTPAALQISAPAGRTQGRRTRRSVLQEIPALEENTTDEEQKPHVPVEEENDRVCEAEPVAQPKTEAHTANTQNDSVKHEQVTCKDKEMPPSTADQCTAPNKKPRLAPTVKQAPTIPLGKPKSGRVWKDRNKQRFSAVVRDKQLCSSWEKKMQAKREKELVKQYSQQLKEEKARQKERKRREENLKRRADNERKAEIVQVIRNTTKIKRMKKKQLRRIEKRDTLALLQKLKNNNQSTKPKAPKSVKEGPPGSVLT